MLDGRVTLVNRGKTMATRALKEDRSHRTTKRAAPRSNEQDEAPRFVTINHRRNLQLVGISEAIHMIVFR
jgi:hypothetical protein